MRVPLQAVRSTVWAASRALGPPVPVAAQRAWFETFSRLGRVPRGTSVQQVRLGGRPAERVTCPPLGRPGAAEPAGPAVLLLHGGAFVIGSPRTHRVMAAHLAAATGGPVLTLDYRRAPEHPYPAAVDDARAAFEELSAEGPTAVAGDSAGGALALLLSQDLRDDGAAVPLALGLISPVVDLTLATSQAYRGPDPLLRPAWVRAGTGAFVGAADARALSPLYRPLHGLPPVRVQVCGHERLRPEGELLAAALRAAGVDVGLEVLEGLWHDVHVQADLVPEGAAALARLGRWLRGTASS